MDEEQILAIERQMQEEHKKDLEALARLKRFIPGANKRIRPLEVQHEEVMAEVMSGNDGEEGSAISLRGKIKEILNSDPPVRWTNTRILTYLKKMGFPLNAKKPIYSVSQATQRLAIRGEIIIVRHGVGNQPNIYRGKGKSESGTSQQE